MDFSSVDDVLDFAIKNEEEAEQFYMQLSKIVDDSHMRKMFEGFAREELGHKKKLEGVKEGKFLVPSEKKVLDMRIADMVEDIQPHPDMGLQEALVLAMKKEKAAFALYSALASATDDPKMRGTFEMLAEEEAKHKLRFEIEYDEMIMNEN